jgi:hypothetical protein
VRGCSVSDQRVHEVWQPAHQAEGRFCAKLLSSHAAVNVFDGFSQQKREAYRLAVGWRRVGQQRLVSWLVL